MMSPPPISAEPSPILGLEEVDAGYRGRTVIQRITLEVRPGEITAIVGHNGAGKSTLFNAIFGLIPLQRGQLRIDGQIIVRVTPERMLSQGIALLPQGQRVFSHLTVRENLEVCCTANETSTRRTALQRILNSFPSLEPLLPRRAGSLSGGYRQMLALASALIQFPRLLLLDEPSLGLQEARIDVCFNQLRELAASEHVAMLIIEHRVKKVLSIADRIIALRRGEITLASHVAALAGLDPLRSAYL